MRHEVLRTDGRKYLPWFLFSLEDLFQIVVDLRHLLTLLLTSYPLLLPEKVRVNTWNNMYEELKEDFRFY